MLHNAQKILTSIEKSFYSLHYNNKLWFLHSRHIFHKRKCSLLMYLLILRLKSYLQNSSETHLISFFSLCITNSSLHESYIRLIHSSDFFVFTSNLMNVLSILNLKRAIQVNQSSYLSLMSTFVFNTWTKFWCLFQSLWKLDFYLSHFAF